MEYSELAVLFNLAKSYEKGMTAEALYEATRGTWQIGERRNETTYAIAVAHGRIREVYHIERWQIAGTTAYKTRPELNTLDNSRWEFIGTAADDTIRKALINRTVDSWGQSPFHYEVLAALMAD